MTMLQHLPLHLNAADNPYDEINEGGKKVFIYAYKKLFG